MLDNRE